ncbi:ubiquitin carboxyl-terminal hydrolase 10 [Mastomys coucha]|uniref:ubiquitin carboxyl-terminal hydrolase 10 n=1 Tax=Mastomys coucha TaxID=35658 RepID=UPI001261C92D|nr:ubiquitin carboxyl-terminal hydrolase 10 [Mastomys coucha]
MSVLLTVPDSLLGTAGVQLHPPALARSGRPQPVGDRRVADPGARPPVARKRRTPPGSPAAQSLRRRGGRCECVCAAIRWRRRETRREKPEQHRTSLRRAAMALHNPQYIFGDFSPDEFNQFFVTPRSSVELPPYSGTLCSIQAEDELPDGQEHQRIEFGVDEVIEPSEGLPRNPSYSISSTLNPQAPEFILGCTTSKKTPDAVEKEETYSSIDQYPTSALALERNSNTEAEALENDSGASGLGQRERKKKKKRPPGYYSYLKDGSEDSASPAALVNGHATSVGTNSEGVEEAEFMVDMLPSVMPRTCDSPQTPMDFIKMLMSRGNKAGAELSAGFQRTRSPEGVSQKRAWILVLLTVMLLMSSFTLAELLETVTLIHKPVSLQPRGLINKGNWCYINATLQALVACPPMYHLMKFIPLYSKVQRPCTSTPMIDSFVRLMNEFTNMPVPPKPRQALGDKMVRDIRPGAAFEPTYIYRLLTVIKSSLSEKGRQEDAEEYLGFILNGLHEEMLSLKKLLSPTHEKHSVSNGPGSHLIEAEELEDTGEGSEDEWEQVGPKNKTSVTRQADFIQTPITGIFGGHIRSVVYQQSSKESATLQPFFTLQLDIQSDKIRTVQDALESLVARESVQGYTTKTKQEVEVSRRVTLEKLPPVLVLHLKRFVYEKTGGCQKLVKNIDYPVDLEISRELLSPGVKNKNFKCHRTYRLFAVVYHHGNSATGGHYTTDVFQIGLNGWLRIDDQTVKVINQYQVVKPTADRTAYLLYYRRVDLL